MRPLTVRCFLLALALLAIALGLPGCTSSDEEGSSSVSIVLGAQFPDGISQQEKDSMLDAAITAIEYRLTAYGVTDPVVKKEGGDRVLVRVRNVVNVDAVVELVKRPGYLEFAEVEMNGSSPATLKDYVDGNRTKLVNEDVPGNRMFYATGDQSPMAILFEDSSVLRFVDKDGGPIDLASLGENDKTAMSWMPALGTLDGQYRQLTGMYLTDAIAVADAQQDGHAVSIELSEEGWDIFNQIAGRLCGREPPQNQLAIVLDYDLISSPQVMQPQYADDVMISGGFTLDEAKLLAIQLKSGCLPIDFEVVSVSGD